MNELNVTINQIPGRIEINDQEIASLLTDQMAVYKNLPVSAENRTERKKDIATLRKIRKSVDDRRKEVKASWMEPYNRFEEKVKSLMHLIDEPVALLDYQVKELESQERKKKKEEISSYFQEMAGELTEWLEIDQIFDEKWLNAGESMKKVKKEVQDQIATIKDALHVLKLSVSDAREKALDHYKVDLDLNGALNYINRYEAQKADILKQEETKLRQEEERNRQQERERIRQEERERIQEEERIRQEERERAKKEQKKGGTDGAGGFFSKEADGELPFEQDNTVTAFYKIVAIPEELEQVEMAFNSIGIYFERRDF